MKRLICFAVGVALLGLAACGDSGEVSLDTQQVEEIVWYYPGEKSSNSPQVIDTMNKRLESEIGVTMNLKAIDSSSYKEKMALVVASSEKFDICFAANWSLPFYNNVENGAFLPITEYVDTVGIKLKETLPDYIWKPVTIDGDIYAVPNYQILPTEYSLMIAEGLATKYDFDFEPIKSIPDLEPYLQTIKENEPGLYPYKPVYSEIELNYEQIYPTNFAVVGKKDKELKVLNAFAMDEFKEYIQLMYDWYTKGFIRKDVLSATTDTASDLGMKYAFSWSTIKPGGEIEQLNKYKQPILNISMCEPFTQTSATARTLSAVSRTSGNPAKAVKVLEVINTDKELYNLMIFGLEGVNYEKVSDDVVRLSEETPYKMSAWMFGNQFNAFVTEGQPEDVWQQTMDVNDRALMSPMFGFNFDSSRVANEITQCSAVIKEFEYLKFGVEDPASGYEEFMSKLEIAGAQKIVDECQRQLDEWKKTDN